MRVIHKKLWIGRGVIARFNSATDQMSTVRCGGGGWRDTQGGICRDLERRPGRDCGEHVRRHHVPLAAQAVENPDHARGIRTRHPLRRMSWVFGVRETAARGAVAREVFAWWRCPY